jgi:hypothetical protein
MTSWNLGIYVNKQSGKIITKEFLERRIAEVADKYASNDGQSRDSEIHSKSILDPLLVGTMKKLEIRRAANK